MPLVPAKEIMVDGRKRGYGIASLMGSDLAMVIGLIQAAEEVRSPLLLCFNRGVNPQISLEQGMPMIANAARLASVPVATVLDHGRDMDEVKQAIALGASLVMFDGSMLPYDENVARTREVAEYAHAHGVSAEAELGSISGSSVDFEASGPETAFTDPQVAADFALRTGVDLLAISFGNSHGVYRGKPQLDLERVREIYRQVEIPLVMHGASGLAFSMYPEIVEAGITKVCYYTAMARSAAQEIRQRMYESADPVYHDLTRWTVESYYHLGKELMTLIGSAGKAV